MLISGAPLTTMAERRYCVVGSRHGCRDSRAGPWMALRGGPTEQCLRSGMPSLGEAPSGGAKSALLTFAWAGFRIFESESPSGRNPKQPLPQQWICTQSTRATPAVRPPSRASPLPQWACGEHKTHGHSPIYIFPKALNTPIMAGPMATRKKLGHRQKINGKISLVPILAPISSAAWVRRSRNSSA